MKCEDRVGLIIIIIGIHTHVPVFWPSIINLRDTELKVCIFS